MGRWGWGGVGWGVGVWGGHGPNGKKGGQTSTGLRFAPPPTSGVARVLMVGGTWGGGGHAYL